MRGLGDANHGAQGLQRIAPGAYVERIELLVLSPQATGPLHQLGHRLLPSAALSRDDIDEREDVLVDVHHLVKQHPHQSDEQIHASAGGLTERAAVDG